MRTDAITVIDTIDFRNMLLHEAEFGRVRYDLNGAYGRFW
jgi:hypothetical protein